MTLNYDNEHCDIAATILHTSPGLLDYRLTEYLNELASLVSSYGAGQLLDKQVIALAILTWQKRPT